MHPLWSLALIFTLSCMAQRITSTGDVIPPRMREEVKKLKAHYRTSDIALFNGSIFPHDLDIFEENEQKLLLRESLDVYDRILSEMLNSTQDRDIKNSIRAIRARMEYLRKNYYHSREKALRERLQELWALKTDEVTTQRKAIRELLPVFQAASRLGSKIQEKTERKRRRRQTPRDRAPRA